MLGNVGLTDGTQRGKSASQQTHFQFHSLPHRPALCERADSFFPACSATILSGFAVVWMDYWRCHQSETCSRRHFLPETQRTALCWLQHTHAHTRACTHTHTQLPPSTFFKSAFLSCLCDPMGSAVRVLAPSLSSQPHVILCFSVLVPELNMSSRFHSVCVKPNSHLSVSWLPEYSLDHLGAERSAARYQPLQKDFTR